jgi:FkbM family methyltransferase
MSIYIDCGAHVGKTVEAWALAHPEDTIYAFEPNPACLTNPRWNALLKHFRVKLIRAAVWTAEGTMRFYRNSERLDGQSSTLMAGKRTGDVSYETAIEVPTVDFSRWLRRTVPAGEQATVKMDIEGAEYAVLMQMIREKTIRLVRTLRIEWHYGKFVSLQMKRQHGLVIMALRKIGTALEVATH